MLDKQADLAGPGIGTYEEVAKALPQDYESLLTPMETMQALYGVKQYIEDNLAKELGLTMVQVPLIVDRQSGVNDMLDRDGSRTPVEFPCGLGLDKRIDAFTYFTTKGFQRHTFPLGGCLDNLCIDTFIQSKTTREFDWCA